MELIKTKNYIDIAEIHINPDLQIGLYYVMECYNLRFTEMEYGTCRMVMLKDEENGEGLNYEEITARDINTEKLQEHFENFNAGIMPGQNKVKKHETKEAKEFGWLSPTGEFTQSPFGEHEESAERICSKKGFVDEYWKWVHDTGDNEIGHLMRDYLVQVKGYCLIHNPAGYVGYIVTNLKDLTKNQREFLYSYFMDMGDQFKAKQFLEEE